MGGQGMGEVQEVEWMMVMSYEVRIIRQPELQDGVKKYKV